jgi:hypothetical protein
VRRSDGVRSIRSSRISNRADVKIGGSDRVPCRAGARDLARSRQRSRPPASGVPSAPLCAAPSRPTRPPRGPAARRIVRGRGVPAALRMLGSCGHPASTHRKPFCGVQSYGERVLKTAEGRGHFMRRICAGSHQEGCNERPEIRWGVLTSVRLHLSKAVSDRGRSGGHPIGG